ncbi:FHA domain-containing protein, partial [Geodermatophilus sp. SYSU D00779]
VALSLVDLDSRNGTFVNGNRVTGRVVLEHGDVVRLGATEFVVVGRRERAPAPARPAPPPRRARRRGRGGGGARTTGVHRDRADEPGRS